MATTEDKVWIHETCLAWRGEDPAALLEALMSDERCAAFGPVHHFLVGASLLACAWQTAHHDGAGLSEALAELDSRAALCRELHARSGRVRGGGFVRYGIRRSSRQCAPAPRGWSEGQLMVSEVLSAIARRVASLLQTRFAHRRSHGRPMV
ncbi:MAG: DUF5714 domain-containing protein [Collinsella intestinalis]